MLMRKCQNLRLATTVVATSLLRNTTIQTIVLKSIRHLAVSSRSFQGVAKVEVVPAVAHNSCQHSTHISNKPLKNLKLFLLALGLVEGRMRVREAEVHNVVAITTMVKVGEAVVATTPCTMEIPNTKKMKVMAMVVTINLLNQEVVGLNPGINRIKVVVTIWEHGETTIEAIEAKEAAELAEETGVIATKVKCNTGETVLLPTKTTVRGSKKLNPSLLNGEARVAEALPKFNWEIGQTRKKL